MPDLGSLHVDTFLTNLSVAYMNEEYSAPEVFPVIPVGKRSDKYAVYNKESFLRNSGVDAQGKPVSLRRPGTRSLETYWNLSNQSYYCEQLARNIPVTDAQVRIADAPLAPVIDATMVVTETLKLDNENAVASKAMKRSNYASSNKAQLVTATTSWAAASGKPITTDIPNAKKGVIAGILKAPNKMLLDYNAAVTLSQSPDYVGRIQYVSMESLTMGGLMPVIEGLEVVEARTQKVTSAEGVAAATTGFSWTDDQGQDAALIYYCPKNVTGLRTVAFGATFDTPDDTLGTHDYAVARWYEPWIEAERVEVRTTRDWRFICTDGSTNGDNASGYATGGYLISGTNL